MGEDRQVQAGDRTVRLHVSSPAAPTSAGVVLLHPWWGLNEDVVAYADRLSEAGFAVVAPDLYGGQVVAAIDEAERLSESMDEAAAGAAALAAVENLVAMLGQSPRIGCVGFSMGAGWAVWLGGKRPDIAATALYYGTNPGPSLARSTSPVLGHFAEIDPYEPEEAVIAFEATLKAAGRESEMHRYPGTHHWFAEPSRPEYDAAAAELAFTRTVDFLRRGLVGEPGR